jgi:putative addiction module killer protein
LNEQTSRLDQLKAGLLGDWKTVGGGVRELRIDHGPGFRVYYGQEDKTLILLLFGGDKSTQAKDARAVPVALRTVVDAVGGMAALADKTGLSRETLYRTLSERGNPRLDTLAVILAAFGLRLTVQPAQKSRARRSDPRPVLA